MRDDAARDLRAEDYEFLRKRARAHLQAVDAPGQEPVVTLDAGDLAALDQMPGAESVSAVASLQHRPAAPRRPAPVADDPFDEPPAPRRFAREAAPPPASDPFDEPPAPRRFAREAAPPPASDPFDDPPAPSRGFERESPASSRLFDRDAELEPARPRMRVVEDAPEPPPAPPRRLPAPRAYGSSVGSPPPPEPARRTVQITGRPLPARSLREASGIDRFTLQPDRAAMWAVLLGLFLVLVAIATAHA